MLKQSMFSRMALVLCPTLLLFSALAHAAGGPTNGPAFEVVQTNCAATTDAEIVAAIQEKIKADTRFDDQWKHINVSSKRRVVTLSGWVKGPVQRNDLIKLARTTKCVRRVVSKVGARMLVGCGPGQKPCGDMCIDRSEECNPLTKGH